MTDYDKSVCEPVPCPYCEHRETMSARWSDRPREHQQYALMHWQRAPHRAGAAGGGGMPFRGMEGLFECEQCGLRLTVEEAAVLLDAVLLHIQDNEQ